MIGSFLDSFFDEVIMTGIPEKHVASASDPKIPKPPWLKVSLPSGATYGKLKALMRSKSLHTVCEEARCPNLAECWGCGTATFLILGHVCTRNCRFCAVRSGWPAEPTTDPREAMKVCEAALAMGLKHAVITSVTRDDLPDGGASVFAETITAIHAHVPGCTVEVLIPDFQGDVNALQRATDADPEILGHNIETVPRLYPIVRPQANYERSMRVLQNAKEQSPRILTKSGIMAGLGETREELLQAFSDLRRVGCDILTLGQYLRPSPNHLPVVRYYTPREFADLEQAGYSAGFRWVESGPLVRSSYHAEKQVRELNRGA